MTIDDTMADRAKDADPARGLVTIARQLLAQLETAIAERNQDAARLKWILEQGGVDSDGYWSTTFGFSAQEMVSGGVVGAIDTKIKEKSP